MVESVKKIILLRNEFVIPIFFAILLIPLSYMHNTFEEWDGVIQLLAGRAIFAGEGYAGWASHYWPPLYSFLAGFFDLFLPGFIASKLISHISGVLLLYVAYKLAMEMTGEKSIAVLVQLFLVVNPLFVISSIQAENHMLDSLFFVTSILLLFQSLKAPETKRFVFLGLIVGFAGLSRYTSYILVPFTVITLFLAFNWKKAWKPVLMFACSFITISSPWWILNTLQNGSPFATWQYLNIGFGLFDQNPIWWWKLHADYDGIMDIITSDPTGYIIHVLMNMFISLLFLIVVCAVFSPFVVPGWIDNWFSAKKRIYSLSLLVGTFLFIVLVSQAFVFPEVFLSWSVVFTILSIQYMIKLLTCYEKYNPSLRIIRKWFLLSMLGCGFLITGYFTYQYIQGDDYDGGQLADQKAITETLKAYDPNLDEKTVMTVNPARAYYLGTKFLMIPLFYEGEVDGIYSYEGLDEKVILHAQNSFAGQLTPPVKSDYLIYDKFLLQYLPQFSFLFDSDSPHIPSHFKIVYESEEAVVYEIEAKRSEE